MTEPAKPEGTTDPEGPETEPKETDWKAMARQWENRSKAKDKEIEALKPKAERYQALEDEAKTNEERMQEELKALRQTLDSQRDTAVRARIERLAANDFADPEDASSALNAHDFLTLEGGTNDAAIKQALSDLLELKPHWRKSEKGSRSPAPNPAQGSAGSPAKVSKASLFEAVMQEAGR